MFFFFFYALGFLVGGRLHFIAFSYICTGEVRSGLAPNKPVRTGSLREVDLAKKLVPVTGSEEAESKRQYWTGSLRGAPKCPPMAPPEDSGYESFDVSLSNTDSHTSSQTSSLVCFIFLRAYFVC